MSAWWKSPCECGSKRFENGTTMFTVDGSSVRTEPLADAGGSTAPVSPSDALMVTCGKCGTTQHR